MSTGLNPSGLGRTETFGTTKHENALIEALDGGVTGDTTLDDLAGAGLEIDAQTLRLLATIWDGSEIVADVNNESVTTEEGVITDETFIRARRSADTGSQSSGNWVNIFDTEDKDNRDEFNASQQFVPDKDGWYVIGGQVVFGGSTASGDRLFFRIRDLDLSTNIDQQWAASPDGNDPPVAFSFVVELTGGTAYEVNAANGDSSFSILGSVTGQRRTVGTFRRSVVQ